MAKFPFSASWHPPAGFDSQVAHPATSSARFAGSGALSGHLLIGLDKPVTADLSPAKFTGAKTHANSLRAHALALGEVVDGQVLHMFQQHRDTSCAGANEIAIEK
jgi:hypothetical protein